MFMQASRHNGPAGRITTMLCALAFTGCAVSDEPADEPTGETSSAISMAGGATWNGTSPLTLGNLNQETCFLSGISGSFIGQPYYYFNNGTTFHPAEVKVFPDFASGKWKMVTDWGSGTGVQAGVVCINIPYTSSAVHEFSWGNNVTSTGYIGTASTHCFLRDVWATSGLDGDTFNGATLTNLTITRTALASGAVAFDMNSSYVHNLVGDTGWGGATAVCVDYAAIGLWGYRFIGPTNSTSSATSTGFLRDFYPNGPAVATANTLCSITGVRGRWINPSPDPIGINDGVVLINDPAKTSFWEVTTSNGRTADVACVR